MMRCMDAFRHRRAGAGRHVGLVRAGLWSRLGRSAVRLNGALDGLAEWEDRKLGSSFIWGRILRSFAFAYLGFFVASSVHNASSWVYVGCALLSILILEVAWVLARKKLRVAERTIRSK